MATDSGYEKGNYLRVCDICGHRFHFRDLTPIGELRFACPDDAPGLTSVQISRFNARARPLVIRPNKWAKDYSQTGIYQLAEGQIFNFITTVSPAGEQDGASDPLSAAWAAVYLADVIAQGKRPLTWDRTARASLSRNLAYLLTLQYGAPTSANPTGTVDNPRYGGILDGGFRKTSTTIAAGLAFVKAYTATGTTDYLTAADRCATFVRHAQCGDVQTTAYTVFPSGGGAYHLGGLSRFVDNGTGLLDARYEVADVAALWFLRLLANARSTTTQYGDAAATAFFSAATRATLATMISELTTFAETGVHDSTSTSLNVTGLSSTAPRSVYVAALNGLGGAAAWEATTTITTDDFALAIAGLYQANGASAKTAEMMAWLAAFTSNTANRTPADASEEEVFQGITGTYDPALCPADQLVTTAPFTEASGALYDWSSFGLLSPILALAGGAFRTSKDTVSTSVRYTTLDVTNKYLGPIGSSGLTLQPFHRNASGGLVGVSGSGFGSSGSGTGAPPSTGLVFWVKGDKGLSSTTWLDQSGMAQNLDLVSGGAGPSIGLDTINGVPCVTFPTTDTSIYASHTGNLKNRNGTAITFNDPLTIIAVFKPTLGASSVVGGPVFAMALQPNFEALFDVEDWFVHFSAMFVFDNIWKLSGFQLLGPDTTQAAWQNTTVVGVWKSSGYPNFQFSANGVDLPIRDQAGTPTSSQGGGLGAAPTASFVLGNCWSAGGAIQTHNFHGAIPEVMVYDYNLTGSALTSALAYIAGRYASASVLLKAQTSVMRAAKTGLAYRQDPGRYPSLRGN